MVNIWHFFTGHALTRMQTTTAHVMLALAALMCAPVVRPGLWVLEGWGGFQINPNIWGLIYAACGLGILAARDCRAAQFTMMLAAVLMGTTAAALYLAWGLDGGTVTLAVLCLHNVGSAAHLRREGMRHGP